MIEFFSSQADGYNLVIAEATNFQNLDLNKALYPEPQYPKVQGQGCAILISPTNDAIASFLTAQYKNTCRWIAIVNWESRLAGVVVSFDHDLAVGQSFRISAPCLGCLREGKENLLSPQAKGLYCTAHTEQNPIRKGSSRKKS